MKNATIKLLYASNDDLMVGFLASKLILIGPTQEAGITYQRSKMIQKNLSIINSSFLSSDLSEFISSFIDIFLTKIDVTTTIELSFIID